MKKIILIASMLFMVSCDPGTTHDTPKHTYQKKESHTFLKGKHQLEQMGYTDIEETSYPLFCCSKDDSILFSTGFKCKDKFGNTVEGCMCSGLFKGVTLRFK